MPLTYRRENKTYPIFVRLAGVHSREQLIEKTLGRPAQPMPLPKPGEQDGPGPKGHKPQPRPGRSSRRWQRRSCPCRRS